MNTTPENTPTKRSRALPRQWKRFSLLKIGDEFFINRCRYVKSGFFWANAIPTARRINLPPWRRVQTNVLVREDRTACAPYLGFVGKMDDPSPANPGQTHYVGDDCPGGHHQQGCSSEDMARVPQPNSDNAVTGPTS